MKKQLLMFFLSACLLSVAGCNKSEKAPEETPPPPEQSTPAAPATSPQSDAKPSVSEQSLLTLEATVTAINPDKREVTLKNAAGETTTVVAGDEVKNFAQIKVGDKVTINYLEAVDIQVLGPEGVVGSEGTTTASRAKPGEKPAGSVISETSVVVVIESIDKKNETVTVKGPSGESKTVKVENPANLEKVAVGDKVKITYTEALAVKVTEE